MNKYHFGFDFDIEGKLQISYLGQDPSDYFGRQSNNEVYILADSVKDAKENFILKLIRCIESFQELYDASSDLEKKIDDVKHDVGRLESNVFNY